MRIKLVLFLYKIDNIVNPKINTGRFIDTHNNNCYYVILEYVYQSIATKSNIIRII